jgi:2-polyprenyl-6-methoxyphenol hydroxylase-like FAD-dependent oxidoreductase
VCGEFISGKGQQTLERLGLIGVLMRAGAIPIRTAAFYSSSRCYMRRALPRAGIGISRWALDAALADTFESLGGELRRRTRWNGNFQSPAVVRAAGRQRASGSDGHRWFGMKAHARNVVLEADLEMHFLGDSYIGLCRLAGGVVNVCGLFSRTSQQCDARELLRGVPGSLVYDRLKDAEWEPNSFCAVAALPLHAPMSSDGSACCVGDALSMVPPVTGNGMSFAFESAEIASAPLIEFAENRLSWENTVRDLSGRYRSYFRRRLFWANCLHRMLLQGGSLALWLGLRNAYAWQWCFQATR